MEFLTDELGNTSVTFHPPTGSDGQVPARFTELAACLTELPQVLGFKNFIASIHNKSYALRAGGVILEHMVPEPRKSAHEKYPNVLFIEYVAWLCVTMGSTAPYITWLQPQESLARRLIPTNVLDVVLGAMLTAAEVSDKFLPIKVEKAHITGHLPIRECKFRDNHMASRGRTVVDLVNGMGSEWKDVTWLASPAAVLTGPYWKQFAEDNGLEEGDVCVLEMDPLLGSNKYICCNQSGQKLKIRVHVFRKGATP